MKLTDQEMSLVNARLKKYRNVYGDIFEEIYDHIVSTIETKREGGDKRQISVLIKEVLDVDFGGQKGLMMILLPRASLIRSILWDEFVAEIKKDKLTKLLCSSLILGVSLIVPQSSVLNIILFVSCFIISFLPLAYLCYLKGIKQVLFTGPIALRYMGGFALPPMNIAVVAGFTIKRFCADNLQPINFPAFLYCLLLLCMLLYEVSFIKFCNQKFKIEHA